MADDWNAQIIAEFHANEVKVGGTFEGAPLLLLTTTGAKTGSKRVNPMMYQQVEGAVAVFASKSVAPTNPDWYHNLVANPRVRVEVGSSAYDALARVASGDERARIWSKQKASYPNFAEYESATTREIPVIVPART